MYILDDDGQPEPCDDVLTYGRWFADVNNRKVALSDVPGGQVSTIFLGIDHSHHWHREHVPILWETLIMGGTYHGCGDRYCTRSEAIAGHERIVANLRAGLTPYGQPAQQEDDCDGRT